MSAPFAWAEGKFVVLDATIESEELSQELEDMQGDAMLQDLADAINAIFIIP